MSYLVLALLAGALLTAAYFLTGSEPAAIRRSLVRTALALACTFLFVHTASLLVQGAKLTGGNLPSWEILSRYILRTQSGNVWLLRAGFTVVFLLLTMRFLRRDDSARVLLLLSLPLVASRSLSGHAVAVRDNTIIVVAADAAHLIATAFWAGGLPFLFYSLIQGRRALNFPPSWAATAVKRFSRVALLSVTILLFTGVYQSLTHVARFDTLVATSYGNVLMLKLVLFMLMLVLGAINFRSTKPLLLRALGSSFPPNLQRLAFTRIGAESLLGVSILILTGFLTLLPPATHSGHATASSPALESRGDHRHAYHDREPVTSPPFKPADGASVEIIEPKNGQTIKGDQVPLKLKLIKGKWRHHVHAYVDNELMGMFESENGILTGISPGNHVLKVRVVETDHKTELDASDEVQFTVIAVEPQENKP